eukprot:TRINITY_DN1151_c0_g1_i2.p1 TRINITY_DN1151_c0_g1~~TRINITY_DN1151_c0_g1_i2.p1  ORF type:complete len:427 (+),score=23.17 TRINITY_DN1151_c0_g1_i2:107-1282(+)
MSPSQTLQAAVEDINSKSFMTTAMEVNKQKGVLQAIDGTHQANQQGIVYAQITEDRCVILKITLLAAGFVIGPGGKSIDRISMVTTAQTTSWTFTQKLHDSVLEEMELRAILISGSDSSILSSINIIQNAVNRYKNLVEASSPESVVDAVQVVDGIEFIYKPPPLRVMPRAARTVPRRLFRRSVSSVSDSSHEVAAVAKRINSAPCTLSQHAWVQNSSPVPPSGPVYVCVSQGQPTPPSYSNCCSTTCSTSPLHTSRTTDMRTAFTDAPTPAAVHAPISVHSAAVPVPVSACISVTMPVSQPVSMARSQEKVMYNYTNPQVMYHPLQKQPEILSTSFSHCYPMQTAAPVVAVPGQMQYPQQQQQYQQQYMYQYQNNNSYYNCPYYITSPLF